MPFRGDANLAEIEQRMERFAKLGRWMELAHRLGNYCRQQRHIIKQELKQLSAGLSLAT